MSRGSLAVEELRTWTTAMLSELIVIHLLEREGPHSLIATHMGYNSKRAMLYFSEPFGHLPENHLLPKKPPKPMVDDESV